VRDPDGLHLVNLKTKGSRRTLHLSRPIMVLLDHHREQQQMEASAMGSAWSNEHDLVFTSLTGGPLDVDAFGKSVPRIANAAGLGHWSIHELRHSCASLLLHEEVPLEVVSEQMGHTSIRVTKDVYGHLMPRSRARAAEAMRGVLFEDPEASIPLPSAPLAALPAIGGGGDLVKGPLIRHSVRPSGFEPETCGAELGHMQRSVVVRISWSEGVECPPMSVAIRSHLILWLQKWLQVGSLRELGRLKFEVHSDTVTKIDGFSDSSGG
jgi:hypothetical protein